MNDTKQLETLSVLTEATRGYERRSAPVASVRVSRGPYLALVSVFTFSSVLLLRVEQDVWALVLLSIAWLIIPLLALTDRIVFDGHGLSRRGLVSLIMRLFSGSRKQLSINDFETVETNAVRTLRRGGSVRYRYRTQITGKGNEFAFASGGKSYRKLVRELFPLIHEDKLDNRSRDLRDYLSDPGIVDRKT